MIITKIVTDLFSTSAWSDDCCEADIVLLDNWWIKTIKVNQQHISVIESAFWIQHQSTCVSWLPSSWLALCNACVFICITIMVFRVMSGTFAIHFVWHNKPTLGECMKQQVFIAFRPTTSKCAWQHIAADVGDLSSKRQSIQFTCNLQSVSSIKKCWLKEAEETAGVTEGRPHFFRLVHTTTFLENMWCQLHTNIHNNSKQDNYTLMC